MKTFEISSKQYKNGKRHFKLILLEVYPETCVIDGIGTEYNDNGITWLETSCNKNIDSIVGMSLTCEFINDDRTEIGGHGDTGEIEDGIPLFNNASIIGAFTKAYFEDIEIDGITKKFLIGEGYIDVFRYKPFVDKLDEKINLGEEVYGSVEIFKTENNDCIVYRDGCVPKGRIPEDFIFSGYALLGIRPADMQSRLLELNSKESEEIETMDEKTLALITDSVKQTITEMNSKSTDYAAKIADLNSQLETKKAEIEELNAKVSEIETCKADAEKLKEENSKLETEINSFKEKNAIAEMNKATADFSDEEKALAKAEIEAFEKEPLTCEINSITSKIYAEIGKNAKEMAKKISEQNSKKNETIDIFGDVDTVSTSDEDDSIF